MSSVKAQKQKILKLNVKDKKLARLLSFGDVSDRDILFLNYAYEEKQYMHFAYGVVVSGLSAVGARLFFSRKSSPMASNVLFLTTALIGHFYWTSLISKRFNKMVEPYYQKYSIK